MRFQGDSRILKREECVIYKQIDLTSRRLESVLRQRLTAQSSQDRRGVEYYADIK
jgi:hypothetical protein